MLVSDPSFKRAKSPRMNIARASVSRNRDAAYHADGTEGAEREREGFVKAAAPAAHSTAALGVRCQPAGCVKHERSGIELAAKAVMRRERIEQTSYISVNATQILLRMESMRVNAHWCARQCQSAYVCCLPKELARI